MTSWLRNTQKWETRKPVTKRFTPCQRRNFRRRNKLKAEKEKHLKIKKEGWRQNSVSLRFFKELEENRGKEPRPRSNRLFETVLGHARPRKVPPLNLNTHRCHNAFMITAERANDEEEVEVNMAKDGQNAKNRAKWASSWP